MNWNVTNRVEEPRELTLKVREGAGVYTSHSRPIWVSSTEVQVNLTSFVIVVEGLPEVMNERNLEFADVRVYINKNDVKKYSLQAERYLNELKTLCTNASTVTLTNDNAVEILQALAYGRQRLEGASSICVSASDMQRLQSIRLYESLVFDALEGFGYDLGTVLPPIYEKMVINYKFYDKPQDFRKTIWEDDLSIPLGLPEGLLNYCLFSKKAAEQAKTA